MMEAKKEKTSAQQLAEELDATVQAVGGLQEKLGVLRVSVMFALAESLAVKPLLPRNKGAAAMSDEEVDAHAEATYQADLCRQAYEAVNSAVARAREADAHLTHIEFLLSDEAKNADDNDDDDE